MTSFLPLFLLLATFLAAHCLSAYDPGNLLLSYKNGTPKRRPSSGEYRPEVKVSLDRRRASSISMGNGWLRILKSKTTDITMAFVKETVPVIFRQGSTKLVIPMERKKMSPMAAAAGGSPAESQEKKLSGESNPKGLVIFTKKKKNSRRLLLF